VLVVVSVAAVLVGLLLPALGAARGAARGAVCASNLRQMLMGWSMYAGDWDDAAMPLAYTDRELTGGGDRVYWWGSDGSASGRVDHAAGFLSPYLDASLHENSVYECPAQPWGSYRPQGTARTITSTYGYNGYYLSPAATPGHAAWIGHRPWRRVSGVTRPTDLFVFADTLIAGDPPRNNALLDPPMLFSGGGWTANAFPTTCFRHPAAMTGRADGGVRAARAEASWLTAPGIGSVGATNDPHYVPDWRGW
jgi:hypothetical protein